MASSSRPFQSQTFNRLLGTYHSWAQKVERLARRVRVGAVWAVQVAIYPAYAAFQAGRLIYRRIAAADWVGKLSRLNQAQSPQTRAWLEPDQSDGPIKVLLGWLQQPSNPLFQEYLPSAPAGVLAQISEQGLAVSSAGLAKASQRTKIQGIASQLEDRSLVLVGFGNQLLSVLSMEEQAALRRAIAWLLAEQGHYRWQQRRRLRAGKLPLPTVSRRAWWPIVIFYQLMQWMMVGPVAVMTDLFGEAEMLQHQQISRLIQRQRQPQVTLQPLGLPEVAPTAVRPLLPPTARLAAALPVEVEPVGLPLSPASRPSGEVNLTVADAPAHPVSSHPAWIETKAVVVDYVDHPLVSVLRWVDRALLWLEESAQRLWAWVRSHLTL